MTRILAPSEYQCAWVPGDRVRFDAPVEGISVRLLGRVLAVRDCRTLTVVVPCGDQFEADIVEDHVNRVGP